MGRILFFISLLFVGMIYGQEVRYADMRTIEDSLNVRLKALRNAKTDAAREIANTRFSELLKETIQLKQAYNYPFDSLQTLGSITSPDSEFRLFNWNVEHEDGTHSYYCYVVKNSNKPVLQVIELEDKSGNMAAQPEQLNLDNKNWYGALYYDIIPVKKGNKTYYTLLGYDGNNRLSTRKVIETMYFSGRTRVKFGAPILKTTKGLQKRYFIEYMSGQYVSLKHQHTKKQDLIIFDHVSPKAPQLEGMYEHYVTDGSYDAFTLEDGMWILTLDFNAKNKGLTDKFHDPRDDKDKPD